MTENHPLDFQKSLFIIMTMLELIIPFGMLYAQWRLGRAQPA